MVPLDRGGRHRLGPLRLGRTLATRRRFQAHPANPIFSHRSLFSPVHNTGHADLVEMPDGGWAMVFLGVRPRGRYPKVHVNGRETFLAGVDWVDDWPVVVEDRFAVPAAVTSFVDDFSTSQLHHRWIAPGANPRAFTQPREEGGIQLLAGRAPAARVAERLLAVRARDAEWIVSATAPAGDIALVVRVNDDHWAAVERRGHTLSARLVIGPLDQVLATAEGIGTRQPLAVRAVMSKEQNGLPARGPDRIELGYIADGGFRVLAAADGRYLSTEVAGGFTGRVVGVEALGADVVLTRFAYLSTTSVPPGPSEPELPPAHHSPKTASRTKR